MGLTIPEKIEKIKEYCLEHGHNCSACPLMIKGIVKNGEYCYSYTATPVDKIERNYRVLFEDNNDTMNNNKDENYQLTIEEKRQKIEEYCCSHLENYGNCNGCNIFGNTDKNEPCFEKSADIERNYDLIFGCDNNMIDNENKEDKYAER